MPNHDNKHSIAAALQSFVGGLLTDHAISLFQTLGYNTARQAPFSKPTYKEFYESYASSSDRFREDKALVDDWNYVDLLFQLSKDELSEQLGIFNTDRVDNTVIESYLFFVIGLSGFQYSRTALSQITREVNKLFPMPVMILFKHGKALTLAVIDRRLHKKDVQKDVLEKVTLIKDIQIEDPHRAHLEILADLSLENLVKQHAITNYVELHNAWQKTLDIKELNKRFYNDLSNWYFWAMQEVSYPDDLEKSQEVRNATNLIRLITRIIFIWFVKEKDLVPQELFQQSVLKKILNDFCNNNHSHSYYQAILQNLFFGILNQKMDERGFSQNQGYPKNKNQYGIKNLLRYDDLFLISEAEVLELFKDIPFLNGGLFDCLDTPDENGKIIYIDGFSRNPKKQAIVPDYLFFGEEHEVDLNEIYGTKNKKYKTKGLIEILASYKFTVTENTPIEEEVALDPELLGKVFENLLASYNPETKTTARKQTGSFYTPREIVNYMVDESLIAYLTQKLDEGGYLDRGEDLRELLSYTEDQNPFSQKETAVLIKAIDECKILDPACGSGAFPMGILHKLVHILHKIDPQNKLWKERQIEKAQTIDDPHIQEKLIRSIEEAFANNELDYGRKLYLIENCIYGVDIQPIAVQIAKLRFFIALVINQQKQPGRENLGIQALPNLETKFVAANTLIPLEKPKGQLSLFTYRNPAIESLEEKLKQLRHRYFNAKTRRDKLKYQNQDKAMREELSTLLVGEGWGDQTARQIVAFNPYDQNSSAPFFDIEWMFGIKDGFDIVIGNPPYGAKLSNVDKVSFKNIYSDVHMRTPDTFNYFISKAFRIINSNAVVSYIVPNNLLYQNEYEKTRNFLLNNNRLIAVVNIGDNAFESADVPTCVFIASKSKRKNYFFGYSDFRKLPIEEINFSNYDKVLSSNHANKAPSLILGFPKETSLLLEKVKEKSFLVDEIADEVASGISTGGDKIFRLHQTQAKRLKIEEELLKPVLIGREIDRYKIINTNHMLIYSVKSCEMETRENAYKYLLPFEEQLSIKRETKKGMLPWWCLHWPRYSKLFLGNKIIMRQTSDSIRATIDTSEYYVLDSILVLKVKKVFDLDDKYILSILNSKFNKYIYNNITKEEGRAFAQVKAKNVRKLYIPKLSKKEQQPFIDIVDDILNLKSQNPQADIADLEYKIDQMIYEIFSLGKEELKNIEEC